MQARLIQVTRTWDDYLRTALVDSHGEDRGLDLLSDYQDAFEAGYRVERAGRVRGARHRSARGARRRRASMCRSIALSKLDLGSCGASSTDPATRSRSPSSSPCSTTWGRSSPTSGPTRSRRRDSLPRFIYDIGLRLDTELDHADRSRFRDAILAVWRGQVESDGLARLVVSAGLTWREVVILRGYARYIVQIGIKFSYLYLVDTLNQNHRIARSLVHLFNARFDPDGGGESIEADERASTLSGHRRRGQPRRRSNPPFVRRLDRCDHQNQPLADR